MRIRVVYEDKGKARICRVSICKVSIGWRG